MKVALNILGLTRLYHDRFGDVLDVTRRADDLGVDQVLLGEHLVMLPDGMEVYPRGTFAYPMDFPYYEPIATLAAIAAVTRRIRLSTNILVSPLRPALLLAKQLATLDVISNGRTEIGIGVGWQRDEFAACEMPFEGRFGYLEEQVRVCRAAWGPMPASHQGKRVRFTNLHMHPQPPQGARMPIWLGFDATPRGIERVAELADGWAAPPDSAEEIAADVVKLRAALEARGRDPAHFPIRTTLKPIRRTDGSADWDASFAQARAYRDAGVTMLAAIAYNYCHHADEVDEFLRRLMALKTSLPD